MTAFFENTQPRRLQLMAWALYDWAHSAFPIIITTFVFATYFTSHVAENEIKGTVQWANATALAGVMIALCGPFFGAIADHGGYHKRWLFFFTAICVIFTGLLWFVTPDPRSVFFALLCIVISTVAFETGGIFYNTFLPHLAPPSYMGRVSGWAWGLGYVGGVLALCIVLFGFIQSPPAWLDANTAEPARLCGPLVAGWFALFSLPLFFSVPETTGHGLTVMQSIQAGGKKFFSTLRALPRYKNICLYLFSHLIYIDGLNTLFAFGGIYAAGTFGMTLSQVILFGIAMNISAGIGAILFAWMDDLRGSKPTILFSLCCLILLGIPILLVHHVAAFWALGLCLSLFLGPLQAASRTLMARLVPLHQSTEMFGLYAFSGKITAFLGPWLLGLVTWYTGSQRAGMAVVIVFFIVGAGLMLCVREESNQMS